MGPSVGRSHRMLNHVECFFGFFSRSNQGTPPSPANFKGKKELKGQENAEEPPVGVGYGENVCHEEASEAAVYAYTL